MFLPFLFHVSMNVVVAEKKHIGQALFLYNISQVFRPDVQFGDLLFIQASTNATDDHKYSLLPFADFDSSGVLVSFCAFIFM